MEPYNHLKQDNLSSEKNLQSFFIDQLNRIYPAKVRMEEILAELLNRLIFNDLAIAIRATLNHVHSQIADFEEIFTILHVRPFFQKSNDMLGLIEEAYQAVQQQEDSAIFNLAVLAYLQTVENLELASFKVLGLAASQMGNLFISEMIDQNIAESEADYEQLLTLMAKQINN